MERLKVAWFDFKADSSHIMDTWIQFELFPYFSEIALFESLCSKDSSQYTQVTGLESLKELTRSNPN